MLKRLYLISLLLLGCSCRFLYAQSLDIYTTALQEGHRAVEQNQQDQALELWQAEAERHPRGITDPRIGISYIELVTEIQQNEKYEAAVELYYWGLSNPAAPLYEEVLSKEIERLKPIADRDDYKQWRDLLKVQHYNELGNALQRFWKWLDPTPNTQYNERLIEHWLRIAYGRENYDRSETTAYNADERARIYVKYGEPDVRREGSISYDRMQVEDWVRRAYGFQRSNMLFQYMNMDAEAAEAHRYQVEDFIYKKERQVQARHKYPSYEVWVYKDQEMAEHSIHPLIFIFGEEGDSGTFDQLTSVEEMMPNESFRSTSRGERLPPSFFLQMLYYQDLSILDDYFSNAFRELETRLYSLDGVQGTASRSLRTQNRNMLLNTQMQAPQEQSTIDKNISVDLYQYRLLDDNNEPYLATFLLSNPYKDFYLDQVAERNFSQSDYGLYGFAVGYNEQHEVLFTREKRAQSLLNLREFRGNIDNIPKKITYFAIPNRQDLTEQKFTVKLQHRQKDSTQVGNGLFKEHVRAIGSISGEQKEPISVDNTNLQMGDLIVGMRRHPGDKSLPFGFRVQPDAAIPQGENLVVHFEVYHLEGAPASPEQFQIDYVAKEDVGLLKRIFTRQEKVSLSLNFESRGPHFRENLEIDTSPFNPGDYTLELTAIEPSTEREAKQTIEFTIEEPKSDPLQGR